LELITYDIHEPRKRYLNRKKGIYPFIMDFDEVFRRCGNNPINIKDIDLETEEGQELFNNLVFSRYEGDVFSNVPVCACGYLRGGDRVGDRCPKCSQKCLPITEQGIEPVVWVEVPEEIPAFLNLKIYQILQKRFSKRGGFSTIDWLLDPMYSPPTIDSPLELRLKQLGIKRGLRYFHDNFDSIIHTLCTDRTSIKTKSGRTRIEFIAPDQAAGLLRFLERFRHLVFCRHLPFPSKIGFVLESSGNRKFFDMDMTPALDALIALGKVSRARNESITRVESRVARAVSKLVQFYIEFEKNKIFDKKGIMRKLIYGTSPHWTFRTVITSNFRPHNHESLAIPWGTAVLLFKLHLANKLLKEGYTPNEILTLIYDNVLRTNPKLERLFDQLIAETPGGRGFPVLFTRFPSLKRGSSQRFFIDQIKRDVSQLSTSISVLALAAANADSRMSLR